MQSQREDIELRTALEDRDEGRAAVWAGRESTGEGKKVPLCLMF
jgi:hypothetical protein